MTWLKKTSQYSDRADHGFFSLAWAKYLGFYTMKQPNGNLVHITHVTDLNNKTIENLPDDCVYVGAVIYPIVRKPDQNKYDRIIPIVDGRPITDFYKKNI